MMRKTRAEIVMSPMSTDGMNLHVDKSMYIDFKKTIFSALTT